MGAFTPIHVREVILQPGEFYFSGKDTRISTVLGSCVSITMWHPDLLIGGMCHYMLPERSGGRAQQHDGRYADEAMKLFMREILNAGTHPSEYEVKLFGGGNMFPVMKNCIAGAVSKCTMLTMKSCLNVSCKNERVAKMFAREHDLRVVAEDMGGTGHRRIVFEIWNGNVWVRQGAARNYDVTEPGQAACEK